MGMSGIFIGDVRIGSVAKIAGEPPTTRWFAYASDDRKKGFLLRRLAVEWLVQLHEAEQNAAASQTQESDRQPGYGWTISEEAARQLEEIDGNIREAPLNIARAALAAAKGAA